MNYNYCAISSKSRLYQCLALHNSLISHHENARLFVLCMDDETYSIMNTLQSQTLIPVSLDSLEKGLAPAIKQSRTESEYCWTMKPVFIESLMDSYEDITRITYIDADMYFFNNPKSIYNSCFGKSVWLTPHNYDTSIKHIEKEVGRYNSGFISFKKNKYGLECLRWWKESCLEWCYNTTVGGKFGDQKYLDEFNDKFFGVTDITVPGVNIAPWNDEEVAFSNKNGKVLVNGNKLICYHFCGFKALNRNEFIVQFGNKCNEVIHKPYMNAIKEAVIKVESVNPDFDGFYHRVSGTENCNVFSI